MIVGMSIIACAFMYTLTVSILYFSKNRYTNFETSMYTVLLILSLCNSIIEFTLCLNVILNVEVSSLYNTLLNRVFLTFLFLYFIMFALYIIYISFYNTKESKEKLINKYGNNYPTKLTFIFLPFFIAVLFLLWILPFEQPIINRNDVIYSYSIGPAVYVLYVVAILVVMSCVLSMILNKRKTRLKKYVPLIVFASSFSILFVVRLINPGILLNSLVVAFTTFIMYHTIENPDLKIIQELTEAKNIAERSNNTKSTFIFNVIQKIRTPINNYKSITKEMLKLNNAKDMKLGVNAIIEETNSLEALINDILDISSLDVSNLKTYKSKYNPDLLLKGVANPFSRKAASKNVDFRINSENDLPELYGDSIRIKQVLNTILNNSLKYTDKGFIEMRINSVIKHDVCRLIIAVEDSGIGMPIEKSSKVFYDYGQDIDLNKINENDMNLSIVKKIIDMLGGNIIIKSTEGKGTEIVIVLDQKIVDKKEEDFTTEITEPKKILVIADDNKKYNQLIKLIRSNNVKFKFALGGQKGLEDIRKGNNYDYIIVNDELEKLPSVDVLNKLKMEEKIKNPIVVMTTKENGEKYKELGFDNYIASPFVKDELKKVIK